MNVKIAAGLFFVIAGIFISAIVFFAPKQKIEEAPSERAEAVKQPEKQIVYEFDIAGTAFKDLVLHLPTPLTTKRARQEEAQTAVNQESLRNDIFAFQQRARQIQTSVKNGTAAPKPDLKSKKLLEQVPPFYIEHLNKTQDRAIVSGIIKPEEKVKFDSVENIINFIEKGLAYYRQTNFLSEEEYQRYLNSIKEVWPRMLEMEASIFSPSTFETIVEKSLFAKITGSIAEFLKGARLSQLLISQVVGADEGGGGGAGYSPCGSNASECVAGFTEPNCCRDGSTGAGGSTGFSSSGGGGERGYNFPADCCGGSGGGASQCSKKDSVGCLDICTGPAIWDACTGMCGCNVSTNVSAAE